MASNDEVSIYDDVEADNKSLDSELIDDILLTVAVALIYCYYKMHYIRRPRFNGPFDGRAFVHRILEGPSRQCHELFRMEKHVYINLCETLEERGLLQTERSISVQEQVAMFLFTVGHNQKHRVLRKFYHRSTQMINKYVHVVCGAILELSRSLIVPPNLDQVPTHIQTSQRFYPYFKDCIGVIDGIHVNASVPLDQHLRFRGRKGLTQNVMATCSFEMLFTHVVAGWEGSANDSRIFLDTIRKPSFRFPHPPQGKYYLVDTEYPLMNGFLSPYRGTRYHLQDFKRDPQLKDEKEMFNHLHSSLRNVIERCFGVLNAKWPILKLMPSYRFTTQRNIVVACMALHNFIRKQSITDEDFIQFEDEQVVEDEDNSEHIGVDPLPGDDQNAMERKRDEIANSVLSAYERNVINM